MKTFRTIVEPPKAEFKISHKDKLVSIGSCFSENIGRKFQAYKFEIEVNPFGQQYNPHSIANALERLLNPVLYEESDLVFQHELYHSFDHHGSFSRVASAETLELINNNLNKAASAIKNASVLFLTFGTSHVFSLKHNGKVVSNCHKISGSKFERRLLNPAEIVDALKKAFEKLLAANPKVKIVLTVSPVRYFAFGPYENSVSKAHLFAAIFELQKLFPHFYYFPAYEMVIDDLRDYRFFAEDMLHPNYQASNYVWDNLCEALMDKTTLHLLREMDEIILATKHKPRNPDSEAHKKFVLSSLEKINRLKSSNFFNFSDEENVLKSYL